MYIYIYICVCVCVYIYTYICIRIHIYIYILVGSRQYILTDRLVASIVLLHLQEARLCFAASIVLLQRPDGAFAVALSCFVSGASVLPGSSSCLPHLMLCNLCGKRMWHQAEDRV